MAGPLTNIANRLTPSVPIELTFGASPVATGVKITTLFGHMAASPGTGTPYQVYSVINVGDPTAAQNEVNALAGVGSQIGAMVHAFVTANVLGGFGNFPQFRVVLIPFGISTFGPNQEAITAVTFLRSDKFVSCYPAGDSTNAATLLALTSLVSGIDRDLTGQFGSFMVLGSIDPLATQIAYDFNSRFIEVAALPDSNTAAVPVMASTTSGSPILTAVTQVAINITGNITASSTSVTAISSTAGIYPGASITGTGIPANTTVYQVTPTTLVLSAAATSTASAEALVVTNLPTAGIYPGAAVSGTGIPALTTVLSVAASTITLSANASSTNSNEAVSVQNQISQAPEILAAVYAAGTMGSVFPYPPMNQVVAGGLVAPRKTSDWIAIDPNGASEAALAGGLSPLVVQPAGTVAFLRTRTTLTMNGLIPATSYFDWQDLVTMNDFREDVFLITQNPPFNGNPGGTKASQFVAQLLLNEIINEAQLYENLGAFQGVQTLAPLFQVQPSSSSRGRFDFYVPANVIPGLMVIAGNIQGVSGAAFGDFTL